ncbi:MAG: AAA family ATPase [Chloroflexi bacterium]|nr:AAA family ATPase [Chloroflexota bacterium]
MPTPPTSFVGRKSELAEIEYLLTASDARLVTLIGPGGTGKTRLAIQAAANMAQESLPWRDGVVFVPLAPLSSSDLLVPALANALGFQFYKEGREEPRQQLLNYLRHKQLLLVLDNVEHLLDEQTARLSSDILAAAPEVKLLATSRARLNVRASSCIRWGGCAGRKMGVLSRTRPRTAPSNCSARVPTGSSRGFSPAPTTSPTLCAFVNWCRAHPWPWNWRPPGWNCSPRPKLPAKLSGAWISWRLIYMTCRNANGVSGLCLAHRGNSSVKKSGRCFRN